jgi:CRISPR/Cas system-associated exonuclease Cas4 (RecB family)
MAPLSFSILKDFEQCPRKYYEIKVLRNYPSDKTEAILYGERLHRACEEYIRDNIPLSEEFRFLHDTLEGIKAIEGAKFCELKMSVDKDLKPCGFKDSWCRGMADIVIVNHEKKQAFVGDYKSGNNKYPDTDQLELMALMLWALYPDLEVVKGALFFVTKGTMSPKTIYKDDVEVLWNKYKERDSIRAAAHATGVFNPKQSGLCRRHCPVLSCELNGANR